MTEPVMDDAELLHVLRDLSGEELEAAIWGLEQEQEGLGDRARALLANKQRLENAGAEAAKKVEKPKVDGVVELPRVVRRRISSEAWEHGANGGAAPKRVVQLRVVEQAKPEPEPKREEEEDKKIGEGLAPQVGKAWNGILDRDAPLDIARTFLGVKYWHSPAMTATLRFWQAQFWEWEGKRWKVVDENTMRDRVYKFLDGADELTARALRVRFQPTSYDVNRVIDALKAAVNLEPDCAMPGWLIGEAPVENVRELVALGMSRPLLN